MVDEILIRFSVKDDGTPQIEKLNQTLKKTKESSSAIVPGLESARKSVTGFVSDNAALIAVLAAAAVAFDKIIEKELAYTNQIRQLSSLSGLGAEETSRFIQVLDDYKISADDALLATKALTNNGHVPSIGTLAELSDKYLALNSVEEQNAFIVKNLGKGGLQWVEVLGKGSAALLKQGAAVDQLLLRNQKQLDAARKLEIAQDTLGEQWEKFTGIIATAAIPKLTGLMNELNKNMEESGGVVGILRFGFDDLFRAMSGGSDEILNANEALMLQVKAMEENTAAAEENLKVISERNKATIDGAIELTKANEGFKVSQDEFIAKIQELQAEKEKLYPWEVEKIKEIEDKQADLRDEYNKTAEEFKRGMMEKLAMMALEKIATSDGVAGFSDAEMQKASAVLQTMDVVTAAALEEQLAFETVTTAIADGRISVEQFGDITKSAMADGVVSINEVTTAINAIPSNKSVTIDTYQNTYQTYYSAFQGSRYAGAQHGRASGGDVMAGVTYKVNERGGETFTPKVDGTITPAESSGFDYDKMSRAFITALDQRGR